MKIFKKFILILCIVIILNNLLIFAYGFCTMRLSSIAPDNLQFSETIVGINEDISYSDYIVENWTEEELPPNTTEVVLGTLENIRCTKLNKFYSCVICWCQTSRNSISQISLDRINDVTLSYPISKEALSGAIGSAFSCDVIKIFNSYFAITYFIDDVEVEGLFTTSVYKLDVTEDIETIEEFKSNNELYEREFPEYLSYYYSSPALICLSFLLMIIETAAIVCIVTRYKKRKSDTIGQSKTGTMSHSQKP